MKRSLEVAEFAWAARRAELARSAGYFAAAALLIGALPAGLVVGGWRGLFSVLGLLMPAVYPAGYLAAYLAALRGGRTVNPPGGDVKVELGLVVLRIGELTTCFELSGVRGGRCYVDACPFEALRGLEDVLELDLADATVRVPATIDGFWDLVAAVRPKVQFIDVE